MGEVHVDGCGGKAAEAAHVVGDAWLVRELWGDQAAHHHGEHPGRLIDVDRPRRGRPPRRAAVTSARRKPIWSSLAAKISGEGVKSSSSFR